MERPFCLDCRTVLRGRDDCPGGPKHRVLDLADGKQQARLVEEVWGPEDWRRQQRQLAKAGSGGAAVGAIGDIANGCTACDAADIGGGLGELVVGLLVMVVVAFVFMLVVWIVRAIAAWARERANRPKPHGALLPPTPRLGRKRLVGTVVGEPKALSPMSQEPCVGWALELSCKRFVTTAVMLRDGHTSGFALKLDDGRTLEVPNGMLRLAHGGETDSLSDNDVHAHLDDIDPQHVRGEEAPAIPFERARGVALMPGDRVEVIAAIDSESAGYRDAASSMLRVRDVASVRKVPGGLLGGRELPPPSSEVG